MGGYLSTGLSNLSTYAERYYLQSVWGSVFSQFQPLPDLCLNLLRASTKQPLLGEKNQTTTIGHSQRMHLFATLNGAMDASSVMYMNASLNSDDEKEGLTTHGGEMHNLGGH